MFGLLKPKWACNNRVNRKTKTTRGSKREAKLTMSQSQTPPPPSSQSRPATFDEISNYFSLPLSDAASHLGNCSLLFPLSLDVIAELHSHFDLHLQVSASVFSSEFAAKTASIDGRIAR